MKPLDITEDDLMQIVAFVFEHFNNPNEDRPCR